MPGIPLVTRETTYSRDHMCRQEPRAHLSQEEQAAAEESLSVYCKPVELYNILQRRAISNPSFLQRCLHYKLLSKHKKRIQVSVSVKRAASEAANGGMHFQSLFPLYILLARPVYPATVERSAVYYFSRACRLTAFRESEEASTAQAKFILPEINKLSAEVNSGSLAILVVSCADITNPQGIDLTKDNMTNFRGYCLLGKLPIDKLLLHWEKPNLSFGERAEMTSVVSMQSCFMKLSCSDEEKCVSFKFPYNSESVTILQEVPVSISSEELGAKDASPYDLYSYNDIPANSLPHIRRLRTGNVIFNYKYYNNMLQRTEVTEDFSCPFCLVKCTSYKGLRFHLTSSHDLFRYEFWVNEDYQAVIVSLKTDVHSSEVVVESVDPRQETFFFCYKPLRRRKQKRPTQNPNHVHPLVLDSDVPAAVNGFRSPTGGVECVERDTSTNATGVSSATGHSFAEPESAAQSVPGSNLAPPAMLQFAKTRKLSVERSDPRNRALLQKRQFFHSHRAQPMALEQVFAERDSEDEVDDDVADLEDRRMLDDFVDVTKDEKQMMHLWNSFVRKQRVLADGHVPWACEAFSKLHGQDLVQAPALLWCWRLFMIKLWNHGLLDPRSLNNCNIILEQFQRLSQRQSQDIDPTQSKR